LQQVIPKLYWFLPEWLKDKRDWTKTWDWVEGSPQLGAWKIYNDLLSLSDGSSVESSEQTIPEKLGITSPAMEESLSRMPSSNSRWQVS